MLHRTLPEPGDVLAGKYRIVRKLGEGGMGVVFEAVHARIEQRVAIKMLLPDVLDLPEVVPRFEREARAAGKLKSDNIARVLDVDISDRGIPYMVMEFLDGSDLGRVIEERKQLGVSEAVDFVLQACNAMVEAHAAGVIHRDLKPSNLFVTTTHKVKVLDFGISKLESENEARVTATQTVVGTPLYMSPEQVRSAKHVDARTDIWSLGIILYELLAGRTPFEGSTTAAAAAICIDAPPPMSQFRADVPAELERALLGALEKDPERRFPNVQSLASAIAPFGSGAVRGPDTLPAAIPVPSRPNLPPSASGDFARADPVEAAKTVPGWTTSAGKRRTNKIALVAFGVVGALSVGVLGGVVAVSTHRTAAPVPSAEPAETTAPLATTATASASVSGIASVPSATVESTPPPPTSHTIHVFRPHPSVTAAPTHAAPAPTPTRL